MEGGYLCQAVMVPGWSVTTGDHHRSLFLHTGVRVQGDVGTGTGLPCPACAHHTHTHTQALLASHYVQQSGQLTVQHSAKGGGELHE